MKYFNVMKQVGLIHHQPELFFSRIEFQLEKHFNFYNINVYVLRITIWLGTLLKVIEIFQLKYINLS